jgi:phenylacetic acid degradation operon negative regulatory protein
LRKFPLIKIQQKHWDKIWRLVTFDIPEKSKTKRDLLRQKLLSLGFAQLQKSAYISPHNISQDLVEFLEQNNLLGQAWLLEVKHKYLPPAKTFANRLWPLEKINQEYSILIEKLQTAKLNEPKLKKIINQYLLLLAQDPHLPFDLLPKTWAEPELRRLINKFTFLKRTRSRIN